MGKNILTAAIFLFITCYTAYTQTVVVTDDATYTSGHASSVLDVKSISKGLLIPRVTQAQRNSISSPATGLMVFQTDNTPGFYYYTGATWTTVAGTSSVDGSETKLSAGTSIAVSGTGTTGTPYIVNFQPQSVTQTQRDALTGLTEGRYVWCSNCGPAGELQVWDGAKWTNSVGGVVLPVLPTLTTTTISSIRGTSASGGGNITSNGGETLIARGVCWNIASSPTIANWKTTDGTATGSYTSSLTGLFPSTTYYVRAYATNRSGTSYGNEVSFTTGALAVGDAYQGGLIAYISGGDGFVAATADQSTGTSWGCEGTDVNGAEGTSIASGENNTYNILAYCYTTGIAAELCASLVQGGYNDWYLPSKDALNQMNTNRTALGMASANYWSSSEYSSSQANYAWYHAMGGSANYQNKSNSTYRVRAVRDIIAVGNNYQGGTVFYLLQPGDAGYVAGETHGLIMMTWDLSTGVQWYNGSNTTTGATGSAIGTGNANTNTIVASQGAGTYAAKLCADYSDGTYSDWYLPSIDELSKLYQNRTLMGGYTTTVYWSSTEVSSSNAYGINFGGAGSSTSVAKSTSTYRIRAIRSF